MLEPCSFSLNIDVLPDFAVESNCHHLDAATDAQDRYLPMESFASEEEFLFIAFRADRMQLWQRFLAQKKRIDVASSREDNAVEGLQKCDERFFVVVRRNGNWGTSGLEDREIVALSQFAALLSEVAGDAYEWMFACHEQFIFLF